MRGKETPILLDLLERANFKHWMMDNVHKPSDSEYNFV
jgi:hypothetical protein